MRSAVAALLGGNDLRLELGEGPVWDVARQSLWWVDSEAGEVFRGRVEADALKGDELVVDGVRSMGEKVGSVTPAADGGLLVAGERHVHVMDADGDVVASVRVLADDVASRLNDGSCDPAGRFLVGSIRLDDRTGQESLVAVDPDRRVRVVVEGMSVSNGIGFSPDGGTLYYVETRPGTVLAFDYDLETGTASGRRVVASTGGTPDGLAVDVDGNLWVAFFGEAQVRCLTPQGDVVAVVEIPVPNATCPEFVGPDLDRLVVATARFRMDAAARERFPESGAFFVADVGVRGLPPTPWAGTTG